MASDTLGSRPAVLDPGAYLWTSRHRYQHLVDETATLDVNREVSTRARSALLDQRDAGKGVLLDPWGREGA